MSSKGQYTITPGSALDSGDFVQVRGEWYRLGAQEDVTRNRVTGSVYSRRFLGITQTGGRLHILLDSTKVKAYRLHR